jgi:hypothetical protein
VCGIHYKNKEEQYRTMGTLGSGLAWLRLAGLETGETADLEICATTKVVHPTDLAVYPVSLCDRGGPGEILRVCLKIERGAEF